MVNETTILENLTELKGKPRIEDQLIEILNLYMENFPVENGYFFTYSPLTQIAEGIFTIDKSNGLQMANDIRDDIRSLPPIHSAIHERKAKFMNGIEFFRTSSLKYIHQASVNAILVVPISIANVVIGYICTTKLNIEADVDENLLDSLTEFGALVGQVVKTNSNPTSILSKRELDTMRMVSFGKTTKEIAVSMKLSEFTINQYVKSAIKKLNATNRAHAVSILLRNGYL